MVRRSGRSETLGLRTLGLDPRTARPVAPSHRSIPLCVANPRVLRQEESLEQRVNAQQSFARQGDTLLAALGEIPVGGNRVEWIAKALEDLGAVLLAEVAQA